MSGLFFSNMEGCAESILHVFRDTEKPIIQTITDPSHSRVPQAIPQDELQAAYGVSGARGLVNVAPEALGHIHNIIINAVHNGPLDQGWRPEIGGDADVGSGGITTLRTLMPNASVTVAVNRRNAGFFINLDLSPEVPIFIAADRHPAEHPELLVRSILGRSLLDDTGVRDQSVIVIDYFAAVQLSETLIQGRTLVDRIVMVAGPGVSIPGWYRIRISTPFSAIARALFKAEKYGPWRVIRGDLFNGTAVDIDTDSLQTADTSICVIREKVARELFRFMRPGFTMDAYPKSTMAEVLPLIPKRMDSGVHGGVRPCVQCNFCDEVCPVSIYPHIIWKHVEAGSVEVSFRFRPQDCIGCRLCDYVCPSKIDLSHTVEQAKAARFAGEEP